MQCKLHYGCLCRPYATPRRGGAWRQSSSKAPIARSAATYKTPPFDLTIEPGLDIDIARYDTSSEEPVPVVVVGAGPAGIATAARLSSQGVSVVVLDPDPLRQWPNNYGVWEDEFEALNLSDCLDRTWPQSLVWLDEHKSLCALPLTGGEPVQRKDMITEPRYTLYQRLIAFWSDSTPVSRSLLVDRCGAVLQNVLQLAFHRSPPRAAQDTDPTVRPRRPPQAQEQAPGRVRGARRALPRRVGPQLPPRPHADDADVPGGL